MAKTASLTKKFKPSLKQLTIVVLIAVAVGTYFILNSLAAATTMFVSPASGNKNLGETFVVEVRANSDTEPVNAVRANLSFPTDKLQFVSIDTSASAYSIEAANTGSNSTGTVRMERGVSGGSSLTGNQLIARVTFQAVGLGAAAINVDATSVVVRSSDNTNILATRTGTSYTVVDGTAPLAPTGLTAGTRTVTTIPLTWTASTDNVGVASYRVLRNGAEVGTPTTNSFTDTGLTPNTSYSYTVVARDAAGNSSPASAALNASTLADTTAPTTPTNVTASNRNLTTLTISWTASTDDAAVANYRVFRGLATGNMTQVGNPVTGTSLNDSGLVPGTTYRYYVVAADTTGNLSSPSATITTSTLADTTAPTAPTNLTVTSQNLTSVGLSWTGSTDNVGVTGYRVFRNGTLIATVTGTTHTDSTGLVLNSTYSYTVAAIDGAATPNQSPMSNSVSVTIAKSGDINRDSAVDIFDLSILLSNYGKTVAGGGLAAADINKNGTIDINDLSILLSNYGL